MKFRFLIVAMAVAAVFSSCLPKYEADPVEAGKTIYTTGYSQQRYADDFFDTALKFNMLLTDAKAQDKLDNLSDVKVIVDGQEYSLQYILFGAGVGITTANQILYTISYDRESTIQPRHGVIVINTGGKTLNELGETDTWVLSLSDAEMLPFSFTDNPNYPVYVDNAAMYITTGDVARSWVAQMANFTSYYAQDYKSDWATTITLIQLDRPTLGYSDFMSSRFERHIISEGETMNDIYMHYDTDPAHPIVITPSCGLSFISAGKLTVSIDESEPVNETYYVSKFVEVQWTYLGNCKRDCTVTYNGITQKQ